MSASFFRVCISRRVCISGPTFFPRDSFVPDFGLRPSGCSRTGTARVSLLTSGLGAAAHRRLSISVQLVGGLQTVQGRGGDEGEHAYGLGIIFKFWRLPGRMPSLSSSRRPLGAARRLRESLATEVRSPKFAVGTALLIRRSPRSRPDSSARSIPTAFHQFPRAFHAHRSRLQ